MIKMRITIMIITIIISRVILKNNLQIKLNNLNKISKNNMIMKVTKLTMTLNNSNKVHNQQMWVIFYTP